MLKFALFCVLSYYFPEKKQKGPFSRKSTLFTWRNTTISCLFLRQRSRETQKRVPSADRLEALQFTRPKGICSISRLEIYILSLKIHIFKLKMHILRLKTVIHGPPASPGFRIISIPPSQARCDTSGLPHFSLSLSLHFKQIESGILCGIRHKNRFYTRAFNHERDVWKKHPDGLCRCSAICRHSSPINNSRCLFRKKPQHTPGYPVRCG